MDKLPSISEMFECPTKVRFVLAPKALSTIGILKQGHVSFMIYSYKFLFFLVMFWKKCSTKMNTIAASGRWY